MSGASRGGSRTPRRAAWLVLAGAVLVGWLLPAGGQEQPPSLHAALSRTLPRAVAAASPHVVLIRPAGEGPEVRRQARSGVVIAPGLVITNASNVEVFGVDDLVVEDAQGRVLPTRLRGRDLRLRIIALACPELSAPPAPLPRAPLRAGSFVVALGATLRAGSLATATFGIISATGRFQGRADQHDAALDASNLGGALVDLEGRVHGVLVHVDDRLGDRSGVGFAIPLPRIHAVLARLQRGEELEPGFLGLEIPRVAGGTEGVEVRHVRPGGPAAQAGVQSGDLVLSLGGRETPTLVAFREASSYLYAGQEVTLVVRRDGEPLELRVRVLPRE